MITTLETQVEKEIKFLKQLDKYSCEVIKCEEGAYKGCIRLSCNHENKISINGIQKVLNIIRERDDLVFYPTSTNFGFSVSFEISRGIKPVAGIEAEHERILTFSERQLPEKFDFTYLAKYFLSQRNKDLMKWYDFDINPLMHERSHFDY